MQRRLIVRAYRALARALRREPDLEPEPVNTKSLKRFVSEMYRVRGARVLFADFYERFLDFVPEHEHYFWTKQRVSRYLRRIAKVGNGRANKLYVYGLSFETEAGN